MGGKPNIGAAARFATMATLAGALAACVVPPDAAMIDPPSLQLSNEPIAQGPPPAVRGAGVEVRNGAGQVVLTGKTDDRGYIRGTPTGRLDGTLTVVLTKTDGTKVTDTIHHRPDESVSMWMDSDTGRIIHETYAAPGRPRVAPWVAADYQFINRPDAGYFRLESGGAVLRSPLLKFDNRSSDPRISVGTDVDFAAPLFGKTRNFRFTLGLDYLKTEDSGSIGSVDPGAGNSIGLFSPNGGFVTALPVNSIRYSGEFRNYGVSARLAKQYLWGGLGMTSYVGMRLGQMEVDEDLTLRTAGGLDFRQRHDFDSVSFGPIGGFKARRPLSGGFVAFGGAEGGASYNWADGRWGTSLTGFADQNQDLDRSKLGFGASAHLGVGYDFGGCDCGLGLRGGFDWNNTTPRIEFADPTAGNGGARIDYGNATAWSVGLRGQFRF